MPRPLPSSPRPAAPINAASPFPVWKIAAVKTLAEFDGRAALSTRDALWTRLYVRGLDPDDAARAAASDYAARPAARVEPTMQHMRAKFAVRTLATMLLVLTFGAEARAEVCDKAVGDSWRSADGPVWLLNPVGFPIGLTILLGGLVLVAVGRLRWVGYAASAFCFFSAAATIHADMIPQHDVYMWAIKEGCRSFRTDLMNVELLSVFACAYALLGYRAQRLASRN